MTRRLMFGVCGAVAVVATLILIIAAPDLGYSALAILGVGAVTVFIRKVVRPGTRPPGSIRGRVGNGAIGAAAGVGSRWQQWRARYNQALDKVDARAGQSAPGPKRDAPNRAGGGYSGSGGGAGRPLEAVKALDVTPADIPPGGQAFIDWIASIGIDDDLGVRDFAKAMAATFLGSASAVARLVEELGIEHELAEESLSGMAELAEDTSDMANSAVTVYHRFVAYFQGVYEWMENGRVLPKKGGTSDPFLNEEGAA
jgi:hypothetical protein